MPPELAPLLQKFAPLAVLLAVGAWMGMALQRFISRIRARAWRSRYDSSDYNTAQTWATPTEDSKTLDAVEQLRIVMGAEFSARPLLNQGESRVFEELCQTVARCRPGWRVMAQVSLGEILRSKDAEAFSCINSKRVDMLLVDEGCRPRHVIEYHGGGHYQGSAAARDAVKKEALRRASIGYHEIVAGQTTPSELRQMIENLVAKSETQQP
jgi:hypothetical protein